MKTEQITKPDGTIGLKGAVESFELHDSLGNTCAAAMFKTGEETFDLYLWDFNSATPRRHTGSLGIIKCQMQTFFDCKVAAGFIQPTVNQHQDTIN